MRPSGSYQSSKDYEPKMIRELRGMLLELRHELADVSRNAGPLINCHRKPSQKCSPYI